MHTFNLQKTDHSSLEIIEDLVCRREKDMSLMVLQGTNQDW